LHGLLPTYLSYHTRQGNPPRKADEQKKKVIESTLPN
jgi:hypothetical protein